MIPILSVQEFSNACGHHWSAAHLLPFLTVFSFVSPMVTQWQDSVNNSAGLQAHVQRDPSHPTITPLQISSLLFNPACAHPSNIILLLLILQLLWVWICHTHIHIWYVFTALVLNYCTKYHHKSVCVYVCERQTSGLPQVGFIGAFSFNWNTHTRRQMGLLLKHTPSESNWCALWDANDIQMYSVQCVCASCSQRKPCPCMAESFQHFLSRSECHWNEQISHCKERECVSVWLMCISSLWGFVY